MSHRYTDKQMKVWFPTMKINYWRSFKRSIKLWVQRHVRGWDDSETWSLYVANAQWMLPRLKKFKEITICHPINLTEQEWDVILNKMIYAFQRIAKDETEHIDDDQWIKVNEGLELYHKYYLDLWW